MITRAEHVTREGSRVVLDGYAQVAYEGLRIQADRIEIDEEELRVRAEGNVVFERRDEKVVAESMEGSLEDGTAIFRNARGILGQDFHFVAETLEELEDGAFAIERGAFTTCAQPNPRWNFTASRAVVRPQKHVWLRNVSFRVKNVPVTYFPALYYPLEEDGRQTGLLIPRYSRSDLRGHLISQGFYWALNRSMDATFSVDHFTVSGTGLGMDYRYRGNSGSRGEAEGFLINDKTTENREYSLSFNVAQRLPARFRLSAAGDMFSSFDFSRRFQDSFSRSTRRYQRAKVDLNGQLFGHRLKFKIDRKDTQYSTRNSRRQTMPQLSIKRRSLNLLGNFVQLGYEADYVRVGPVAPGRLPGMEPALRWTHSRDFDAGSAVPRTARRKLTRGTCGTADRRTRRPMSSIRSWDCRGGSTGPRCRWPDPSWNGSSKPPGASTAARYKHLVEPEASWDYRKSDDKFDLVNRFDRYDSSAQDNQISFGLVNRLLAKRYRDGVEESSATDVITWRIQQTWYFDPTSGSYDSRYVSSSFEDSEVEVRKSPIRSNFRFTPDQSVNGDWTMEWDPDERLFTSIRARSPGRGPPVEPGGSTSTGPAAPAGLAARTAKK